MYIKYTKIWSFDIIRQIPAQIFWMNQPAGWCAGLFPTYHKFTNEEDGVQGVRSDAQMRSAIYNLTNRRRDFTPLYPKVDFSKLSCHH